MNRKAGRRNKYDTHVLPRLDAIVQWRANGLTEEQVAENLGISYRSLNTYKLQFPQLLQALNRGKADADAQVENALFKRAIGYEYETTEANLCLDLNGQPEGGLVTKRKNKHVPPHVGAIIFYLKNRCSQHWSDRLTQESASRSEQPAARVVVYVPATGRESRETDCEDVIIRPSELHGA